MLPDHLLPQISPSAAKVYLVLICVHRRQPADTLPTLTISLPSISALSALSVSCCKKALRQLCDLRLLHRLPRKYHTHNTYLFLRPNTDPTQSRPTTPHSPTNSHLQVPHNPSNSSPNIPHIAENAPPESKSPMSHPQDPLLNMNALHRAQRTLNSLPAPSTPNNLAALSALLAQLTKSAHPLQESRS